MINLYDFKCTIRFFFFSSYRDVHRTYFSLFSLSVYFSFLFFFSCTFFSFSFLFLYSFSFFFLARGGFWTSTHFSFRNLICGTWCFVMSKEEISFKIDDTCVCSNNPSGNKDRAENVCIDLTFLWCIFENAWWYHAVLLVCGDD